MSSFKKHVSIVCEHSWGPDDDMGCCSSGHPPHFSFTITIIIIIIIITLRVVVGRACASVHMWKSENNFMELVLSFHLYVGPWDQAQVLWLLWWAPLRSESSQPALTLFLKKGSLGDKDKLGWSVRVQHSPDSKCATAFGFYVSAGDQTQVLMLA